MQRWETRWALGGIVLTAMLMVSLAWAQAPAHHPRREAGAAHRCRRAPGVGHQLYLAAEPQWHAR